MAKQKPKLNNLLGLSLLEKTVELALYAPYIRGEKPFNVLIASDPESGKTAVLEEYKVNKGVAYLTNVTAYGLERDVLPKIANGEIRTIIIPDLLVPLSRDTRTRKSFVGLLNALIEEGVTQISTFYVSWRGEARINLITAVTREELLDARHDWAKMGFLSRFVIFSYKYPMSLVVEIFKRYSQAGIVKNEKKLTFPKEEVDIELDPEVADRLDPIAIAVGQKMGLYGFRAKINFRSMLKAIALRNGHKKVTESDFLEFLQLTNYLNLDFNPIG
jgi:hypothetical protein